MPVLPTKGPGRGSSRESGLARAVGAQKKRPDKTIPLPGWLGEGDRRVTLWALRDDELSEARREAMKYLTGDCKLDPLAFSLDPSLYDDELERQILARCLRDPSDPMTPWAEDAAEVRLFVDPDVRQALMAAYNDFVDERSPLTRARSDAEVTKILALLGEEPSAAAYLSYCDTATLRSIARELGARLTKLMKAS